MPRPSIGEQSLRFLVLVLAALCVPTVALAHKVNVFAYVEGDTVCTQSYFNDGAKCRNSEIKVFDAQGNVLLEGKTDAQGEFSFVPPVKTDLLIVLDAGMGHRAEYKFQAAELADTLPTKVTPTPRAEETDGMATPAPDSSAPPPVQVSLDELEPLLERKLAPIRKLLLASQRRARFTEIVGGIGYIVGIMGLLMFFKARKQRG